MNDMTAMVLAAGKETRLFPLTGAAVGTGAYLEYCIVGHGYDVRPGEQTRGGVLIRRRRSVGGRCEAH